MRPIDSSNPFVVLPLTKAGLRISSEAYREFEIFYYKLEKLIPSGREAAIMKTKLQEACNWAVEAVACRPEFQRTDFLNAVPEATPVAQPQVEGQGEISPPEIASKEP